MENFTDRRMRKNSLLKLFHRISVLHGKSGKNNQFGNWVSQHMAAYHPIIVIQYQLTKPVHQFILGYKTTGLGHR